jgi:hypothetical protein
VGSRGKNSFDCTWKTSIDNVPEAAFYEIVIGDHSLPKVSRADVDARDWDLGFTLGTG